MKVPIGPDSSSPFTCAFPISIRVSSVTGGPGCIWRSTRTTARRHHRARRHRRVHDAHAAAGRATDRRGGDRAQRCSARSAPTFRCRSSATGWHAGGYLVAEHFQRRPHAACRRRSASVHADRRLRHEHRHRGMANLSWKLAAVMQGWGGDKLLATYEGRTQAGRRSQHRRRARDGQGWHDIDVTGAIEQDAAAGEAERRKAAQSPFVVEEPLRAAGR